MLWHEFRIVTILALSIIAYLLSHTVRALRVVVSALILGLMYAIAGALLTCLLAMTGAPDKGRADRPL